MNLQKKSKHKNNKCFSWVTAVRVISLTGSHSLPHLLRILSTLCWFLDLLWGQLRFWSGPTPVCSCLQCPQLSELGCFFYGSFQWPFLYSIDTVCLVDHVDLICSLYSYISCCPSRQLPWVPGAARNPVTQAPPPHPALTEANPSPPGQPQEQTPVDDPHAEVEIKPQLKPRGSVAKEEDPKPSHQLYKLQVKSTQSTR